MAPLVLKIKGNKSFSPFSNLDSEEDLSKTWRVCTKVKDSLENGSRLENLSWRLWFRQHALNEKSIGGPFQKLSKTTASQLDHHQGKLVPLKDKKIHSSPRKRNTAVPTTTAFPDDPGMHQPGFSRYAFDQQSLIPDDYNIIPTPTVLQLQHQPISQPQQQQPGPYPSSSQSSPLADSLPSSDPEQRQPSRPSQQLSPPPLIIDTSQGTSNFTLHRFTSDQASDQMVELKDIFDVFDGGFLHQAGTAQLLIDDSNWTSGATTPAVSAPHSGTPLTTTTTLPSLDSNSSNYCTPLSSPSAQHSYHHPIQQPPTATTQYSQNFAYHNQQPQYQSHYQPQYQDQNSNQQYSQQHSYPSPVNNYGMFMSVPSSPLFAPQQLPSDFDPPATTLETVYVANPYSVQPPSSTGSGDMKPVDSTPQHSTLHTPCINTTLSTPPLSTSTSSSSSSTSAVTSTRIKNDEMCTTDDDTSTQTMTTAPSAQALMNNDQSYPLRHPQYHHQHVFPASAPTTPPLHTQPNPFDQVPRHTLNTAASSPVMSSATPRILDVADAKPICTNCAATSTPLWRRSSEDDLLCNACGLYQKLHNAPRPKTLKPHSSRKETKEEDAMQLICSNCSTTTTPLWRRDDEGAPLCNACGLYLKLHHERRPLSMKTDIIKKRQRYETNTQTSGRKLGKKTKGDSTPSPSHSTPPSPDVTMTLTDYHMIQTARTAPSSPTLHHLPYSYIQQQHHLPSFMD